ncbi:hypothetical protein [Methanocella sp. MCL-LM]|uniref:hypothetical protein n=1 Tax=Methanocella sp. MCL-LM TaxID=3412035 RepID=UPI003C78A256
MAKLGKRDVQGVRDWKSIDLEIVNKNFAGLRKIIDYCLSVVEDEKATTRERVDAAREAREAIIFQLEEQQRVLNDKGGRKKKEKPEAETGDFSAGMYS